MGIVKVRALFRSNAWISIQEASRFSGIGGPTGKVCPTQFWRYGLKYQLIAKFASQESQEPEFVRTVRVRATQPQISLQAIGKWKQYSHDEPLGRNISSHRNQQLNVLMVDPQRLITQNSAIHLQDLAMLSDTQKQSLETSWPKFSALSRQLVEISTPVEVEHLCKAPNVLNRFRRGHHSELEALLNLPIPPVKLLESVLQTGNPELFSKLVASNRMPSLNWSQPPKLKGHYHLLGALPVDARLIFLLAAKQNLAGLEQQIQQGIPWGKLLSEAAHHSSRSSAINFLGFHLPCPTINFKPDQDPLVRKNLARCAFQYSAGFNILSPTAIALLKAGAGLEESLELCQPSQGTALTKYVLQNFQSLRHLFSPQSTETWRNRLTNEPWLVKFAPSTHPKNKISTTESIELF